MISNYLYKEIWSKLEKIIFKKIDLLKRSNVKILRTYQLDL